jgi:hypothetical protein
MFTISVARAYLAFGDKFRALSWWILMSASCFGFLAVDLDAMGFLAVLEAVVTLTDGLTVEPDPRFVPGELLNRL